MRKIVSKHRQNKKKRLNQFILGGVLIFVMLFSVLSYSFQGKGQGANKIKYNDFEFVKQNAFWILNIENAEFVFKHNPYEVEEVDSKVNSFEQYSGKPLYISSEDKDSELEVYRNLVQIALRIRQAYLQGEEGEENLPVKNCSDNFVVIKESNISKLVQDGNCVFIQSPQENLTKITDEFLFKVLRIRD